MVFRMLWDWSSTSEAFALLKSQWQWSSSVWKQKRCSRNQKTYLFLPNTKVMSLHVWFCMLYTHHCSWNASVSKNVWPLKSNSVWNFTQRLIIEAKTHGNNIINMDMRSDGFTTFTHLVQGQPSTASHSCTRSSILRSMSCYPWWYVLSFVK